MIGCYMLVPLVLQVAKCQVKNERTFSELMAELIELARHQPLEEPSYKEFIKSMLDNLNITVWCIEFIKAIKEIAFSLPAAKHYSISFSTDSTEVLIRPIVA